MDKEEKLIQYLEKRFNEVEASHPFVYFIHGVLVGVQVASVFIIKSKNVD